MSARKIAAARVATKPIAKLQPEPTKRTNAKKATKPSPGTSAPGTSAPGTIENISQAAEELALAVERALAEGHTDALTIAAIQALMAAACRCYSAQVEAGSTFPPLAARSQVTSTDVMITASGLLKAANLAVFELGMWQSWTGR
jgi:hypothetical protein